MVSGEQAARLPAERRVRMPTEYFLAHIWLIPLFPLAGAALMLFFGRRLPNAGVNVICVGSVFLAMIYAFGAIVQLIARPVAQRVVEVVLFDWVPAGAMHTTSGPPGELQRAVGHAARPAVRGDALRGDRRRIPDSRLFHRLHGARGRLLPLLRLSESVHVLDADAGAGEQPAAAVRRMGRRGAVQLPADRVLLPAQVGVGRGEEGVHRQPHRRRGLHPRACFCWSSTLGTLRFTEIGPAIEAGGFRGWQRRDDRHRAAAVCGRDGQVGADSAVRLAAGRHGRPHAGERADPRGDHGDGGRVHGHAHERGLSAGAGGAGAWWPRSAR